MTGPGAGTTCWSPDHFATRCYRRVDDLHRERFGPHAITPHWPSRLRQRTAAPVESHLPVLGPFPAARVKTCVSILGVCSSPPQRPDPVVSGGAGGEHVEGGDTRAAGPGGAGSGGARGVRVDTFPVEDMAVSTRRPRPASPLGFPSVPQFSPRAALRPVTAEPGGVPTGGTGDTTGVVTGGSGSGGAGAGDTGSATPTPRTVQQQPQQERAEEEPQEQQQGQVPSQQTPAEAVQRRLRDLPDPAPARFVRGPLPSPPVPPTESLFSSPWTRHSPLSRAVSPEPRWCRKFPYLSGFFLPLPITPPLTCYLLFPLCALLWTPLTALCD
ncbi:unnamed protein product [Closterium sp. NIES-54]